MKTNKLHFVSKGQHKDLLYKKKRLKYKQDQVKGMASCYCVHCMLVFCFYGIFQMI